MEATFQVSHCCVTFQAYQENSASVLPDVFLLVRHILMCAGDCDGTLEHQRNIAPSNVVECIPQSKNSRGTDGKKIVYILKRGTA